jgi:hypothetical protein
MLRRCDVALAAWTVVCVLCRWEYCTLHGVKEALFRGLPIHY